MRGFNHNTILFVLMLLTLLTGCGGGSNGSSNSSFEKAFPKIITVFGIRIVATEATPDNTIIHAANVMAEYLDNNEDGSPDNQAVVDKLVAENAILAMASTENEFESNGDALPDSDALQDLYASEVAINDNTRFDASLEEVLHLITHIGYAGVYPSVFGESIGSTIADAMDVARGGQFTTVPASYPAGAWYTYDDTTCDYSCMATEYVYWALTSILGAQDFPGRLAEIQDEWKLNTRALVRTQDTRIYALLTDPQYALATTIPDGQYAAESFTVSQQ